MIRTLKTLFAVLALLTLAAAQTSTKSDAFSLPSEETVNAFLHATWGYNQSLSWKIASIRPSRIKELAEVTVLVSSPQGQQTARFFVAPDGTHAVVGEIIPFGAQPFEAMRKELEKRANGPSRGPSTAPVTIVDFSDLQCPHCKAAHPLLEKLLSEDPNVRVVFQNFPLQGHDWSAKAAAYADCVGHQSNDAFWKFIASVFESQTDITAATADEKLTGLADKAGVKGAEIAACSSKDETVGRVQGSVALGLSVDVNSTPTLFLNGRRIANVGQLSYEELKALTDFAAQESKTRD
jgi:protein-disulfide isomerase